MTDAQKLEALIQRAIEGRWKFFEDSTLLPPKDWIIPGSIAVWNTYLGEKMYIPEQVVIFNHDFARALFGEEKSEDASLYMYSTRVPEYQWRLMKAVISDNPIDYMYQAASETEVKQQKPSK